MSPITRNIPNILTVARMVLAPIFFILFIKNYTKRIKENIKRVKKLPKIKGVKKILYPGENKAERYKKNINKKINISSKILNEIYSLNKSWS